MGVEAEAEVGAEAGAGVEAGVEAETPAWPAAGCSVGPENTTRQFSYTFFCTQEIEYCFLKPGLY